jgi:hypothetical protein
LDLYAKEWDVQLRGVKRVDEETEAKIFLPRLCSWCISNTLSTAALSYKFRDQKVGEGERGKGEGRGKRGERERERERMPHRQRRSKKSKEKDKYLLWQLQRYMCLFVA